MEKNIISVKEKYRQYLKNIRNKLDNYSIEIKSDKIFEKIIVQPEYLNANKIIIYCSKEKEVQTEKIIKYSLSKGKKIIVPITNTQKRILEFSELKDFDKELQISTFNIPEPKKEYIRPFNINDADLIIVPGLGFDKSGVRIGYGHGYFDKALTLIKNSVPIFGLAFESQVVEKLPTLSHDIKVHRIITEERIINCNINNDKDN
ncbi:MAG: 5-formyltetrahydrofolate cyclo-ligase [Candidatus Helarchaeota archaeon]